jgi:hypothetical protein
VAACHQTFKFTMFGHTGDPLAAHAVHLALALFEVDLLHLPASIQSPLLSRDPGERGPARCHLLYFFMAIQ